MIENCRKHKVVKGKIMYLLKTVRMNNMDEHHWKLGAGGLVGMLVLQLTLTILAGSVRSNSTKCVLLPMHTSHTHMS